MSLRKEPFFGFLKESFWNTSFGMFLSASLSSSSFVLSNNGDQTKEIFGIFPSENRRENRCGFCRSLRAWTRKTVQQTVRWVDKRPNVSKDLLPLVQRNVAKLIFPWFRFQPRHSAAWWGTWSTSTNFDDNLHFKKRRHHGNRSGRQHHKPQVLNAS